MRRIAIIAAVLITASCSTKKVVTGTDRVEKDSIIIREVMVPVKVPGATIVTPSINIHQIDSLLKIGVDPRIIEREFIREDPETKLKVGILIDRMGNLTAVCEQQERTIEMLQREVEYFKEILERVTVVEKLPWWQQLWHDFKQLIIGAALLLAILTIRKILT